MLNTCNTEYRGINTRNSTYNQLHRQFWSHFVFLVRPNSLGCLIEKLCNKIFNFVYRHTQRKLSTYNRDTEQQLGVQSLVKGMINHPYYSPSEHRITACSATVSCSFWFKHMLLVSTKGLGMVKLRRKPSPSLSCSFWSSHDYSSDLLVQSWALYWEQTQWHSPSRWIDCQMLPGCPSVTQPPANTEDMLHSPTIKLPAPQ